MASDIILQNICRIHQIWYPKRPLFQEKSQKNDTIGYATLIAPEITSEIKPRMYDSLLGAHVGLYCMENLYYCVLECVRECCHCSVTGYPPVESLVAIKGGGEAIARSTNILEVMACIWCSCSRPPEVCVVLSNKRCLKRTCEWQEKSLLPHLATPMLSSDSFWTSCPCFFQ